MTLLWALAAVALLWLATALWIYPAIQKYRSGGRTCTFCRQPLARSAKKCPFCGEEALF